MNLLFYFAYCFSYQAPFEKWAHWENHHCILFVDLMASVEATFGVMKYEMPFKMISTMIITFLLIFWCFTTKNICVQMCESWLEKILFKSFRFRMRRDKSEYGIKSKCGSSDLGFKMVPTHYQTWEHPPPPPLDTGNLGFCHILNSGTKVGKWVDNLPPSPSDIRNLGFCHPSNPQAIRTPSGHIGFAMYRSTQVHRSVVPLVDTSASGDHK